MDNDTELDNLDRDKEAAEEAGEQEEEETSFTDDRRRGDESILIIDGSNPIFTRVGDGGEVPSVRRDAGVMRRYIIHDKKQFLKNGLDITVNKGDGPNSTRLYDELRMTFGKDGRINGATYRGKKILILKNRNMKYSTDKTKAQYVNEFKKLLKKADAEHRKTPAAQAEKHTNVDLPQYVMNDIAENVSDRMNSTVEERIEDFTTNTEITNNELRELRGILDVGESSGEEKINSLKVESDYWTKKADEEQNDRKAKLYEAIAKTADLKADEIRLRLNQKLTSEEGINMLQEEAENNDLTKFAISIAGILTTVVTAGRKALRKGAQSISKFGKAVANITKKLGPVIAALGNLLVKILELGAKGIMFLSKNLWLLTLALTYFVYNEYKDRKKNNYTYNKRE